MTKSRVKIAIFGLIAWALVLTLFLVSGLKAPASAETWEPFNGGSGSGTFVRPDTVTVGWEDNVSFHSEDPVSALKITLGDVVIDGNTYNIVQKSSNACIDFKFEYVFSGATEYHTQTLYYEDSGPVDGFYFKCEQPNTNTSIYYLDLNCASSSSNEFLAAAASGLSFSFDDTADLTKDWYLTISAVYSGQGDNYKLTFSRIKFNPTSKTAAFELSDYVRGYQDGLAAGGSGSGHTDEELETARQEGYNSGKQDGFEDGLESGKKLGYTNGFTDGNKPGSEIFIENGVKTKFARPDNLSASCVLHTFGDGEKRAMRISFGNITLNGKVWSPYLSGTFSALSLKITNPSSGTFSTISWCDLSSGLGLGYDDNKNTIDLTCDSNGVWSLYFAVPMRGETVNLFANGKTYSISNKTSNKDWTFTLTVAYAAEDSNTGETLPDVEYTSVNYNPDTYACAFVPTEAEKAYNDGHKSGKAAGLAEGKKTAYDEGYAAGLAAAKAETKPDDGQNNKSDAEPDNKSDQKPSGSTTTTDKPSSSKFTSWLEENKVILIVVGLMLVGVVVLVLLCNLSSPRRRR